jgi:hypothetical protein
MELEDLAKEDYHRRLEEYKSHDGITDEDIKTFEKTEVIKRSIGEIKKRANETELIRKDPSRYKHVQSKVK